MWRGTIGHYLYRWHHYITWHTLPSDINDVTLSGTNHIINTNKLFGTLNTRGTYDLALSGTTYIIDTSQLLDILYTSGTYDKTLSESNYIIDITQLLGILYINYT